MSNQDHYIITIGRQLGSKGVYMGQRISEHFGFRYVDREILVRSAELLNVPESKLKNVEEKSFSIWESFLQTSIYDSPYIPTYYYMPTGRQIFETQSEIIQKAAKESSCVVVGRCGSYLFRNHPKHAAVFLHADKEYRIVNAASFLDISEEEARKEVEKTDKERARYFNTYTGETWTDLTRYDITIDVGLAGFERAGDILIEYICTRFPELTAEGAH